MAGRFFRVALLLTLALTPLACKKAPTILGVWKGGTPGHGPFGQGFSDVILVFKADGTMTGSYNNTSYAGTYSIKDNQLTMDAKSDFVVLHDTETFTLDGDQLTLQQFQLTQSTLTFDREQ
jgi:heat shock protein HslJ